MSNWYTISKVGLLTTHIFEHHYVREYKNRLAIWRKDGNRLGWEELQDIKQRIWGDTIAVEIYPSGSDVVNKRHTRHLWTGRALQNAVKLECKHPEFQRQTYRQHSLTGKAEDL